MEKIIAGVRRFQRDVFPSHRALFDELATQQDPDVLFITCSDSRIDPNLITQSKPGDLFICRNAGNVVPPHSKATGGITASIEYAVAVLRVRHIIVCGHTDCGAMKGALDTDALHALPHVQEWLSHCRSAVEVCRARHDNLGPDHLREVTEENIRQQIQHLRTHPAVAVGLATGKLAVHGWLYDIETGQVSAIDSATGEFSSLT